MNAALGLQELFASKFFAIAVILDKEIATTRHDETS
tara:strand:- start:572 stop:679 length:108 start_codon:yes stop_codon:yes gene_type:complete